LIRSLVIALLVVATAATPLQAQTPEASEEVSIDELVARALYERAKILFDSGDFANAKQLAIESLERSGAGMRSGDAKELVRSSNEELGIEPRDAGIPGVPDTTTPTPVDPYGGSPKPVDPYQMPPEEPAAPASEQELQLARWGLTGWAGGYGITLGLAVGGPMRENADGDEEFRGVSVLTGLLGGAALTGLGYWLTGTYDLTPGQSAAIASAGTWGTVSFGFLGAVLTGKESDTSDVFKFMAAGGAAGIGGGIAYAKYLDPSVDQVAVINSLSSYGLATGLLFGVLLDPPHNDAYSLQAFLGSAAGMTAGILLRDKLEVSRRRTLWLDVGAASGIAATWVLLYPLIADSGSNNDEQAAGGISILTMAGGVVTAWLLTRGMDDEADQPAEPAPQALVGRTASGRWTLGAPVLEPVAPPPGHRGIGLQLRMLGGRF
jgi:hypothetical protein